MSNRDHREDPYARALVDREAIRVAWDGEAAPEEVAEVIAGRLVLHVGCAVEYGAVKVQEGRHAGKVYRLRTATPDDLRASDRAGGGGE